MNLPLSENKSKIDELKKQRINTFHKRGSRGYVLLKENSTEGTTYPGDDDETWVYLDAQTASIYFHNTNEKKFWRGEKVQIDSEEISNLKAKMENREKRTISRKKEIENKLSLNK